MDNAYGLCGLHRGIDSPSSSGRPVPLWIDEARLNILVASYNSVIKTERASSPRPSPVVAGNKPVSEWSRSVGHRRSRSPDQGHHRTDALCAAFCIDCR